MGRNLKKKILYIAAAILAYKLIFAKAIGAEIRAVVKGVKKQHTGLAYIPEGLVVSIALIESNLDPNATGAAGEMGYMQIMPSTWEFIREYSGLGLPISSAYIPYYNVLAGMLYLDYLYKVFKSWFAVIHAYNVGETGYKKGKRNDTYFCKVLGSWFFA
jgi:soluble lytic murein transglycosylase-like protein